MIRLFQRNNSSQGTDRVKLIADIGSTCSQKTNVYTIHTVLNSVYLLQFVCARTLM